MSLDTCYGPNLVRNHVLKILLSLRTIKHCNHCYTKFVSINYGNTHDGISRRLSSYLEAKYTLLKCGKKYPLHFIIITVIIAFIQYMKQVKKL